MDIDAAKLTPQWMAGFFDGEGYVCAHLGVSGSMAVRVGLAQSNFPLICAIAAKFNVTPGKAQKGKPTRRSYYQIQFTGRGCKPFLEYIKDHVIVKRPQVWLALELIDLIPERDQMARKGIKGYARDHEIWHKRMELGQKIKQLNHIDHDLIDEGKGGVQ